ASAGQDLFDAYMATGGSTPEVMTSARWCNMPGTNEDLLIKTAVNSAPFDDTCAKRVGAGDVLNIEVSSPGNSHTAHVGGLFLQIHNPWAPPVPGIIPGLWIDGSDASVIIPGLPVTGFQLNVTLPAGLGSQMFRWQALMLTPSPANGLFALSNAHDFYQD
ncbi:MAG: hypothetical protein ACJA0V_004723, partial [Planctomycetota bacterium]